MHGKDRYQNEDMGYLCIEKEEVWVGKTFTEKLIFLYYLLFSKMDLKLPVKMQGINYVNMEARARREGIFL